MTPLIRFYRSASRWGHVLYQMGILPNFSGVLLGALMSWALLASILPAVDQAIVKGVHQVCSEAKR